MRPCFIPLLCLVLAGCGTPAPRVEILSPATAGLAGRQSFQLMPPDPASKGELPLRRLAPLLRQGLNERGYREGTPAELYAHYWLDLRDTPLELSVDMPPPEPLGPYSAIHRLRDETGTLHLRLIDPQGQVLWDAQVNTVLSPRQTSAERLEHAVQALLRQVPAAR